MESDNPKPMKKFISHYYFLLATIALSTQAFAQITLSGTVKSESNEPLIGATVQVMNTTYGTVTDIDGSFKLQLPGTIGSTLVVSSIGYITQQFSVTNQSIFSIVLLEDTK